MLEKENLEDEFDPADEERAINALKPKDKNILEKEREKKLREKEKNQELKRKNYLHNLVGYYQSKIDLEHTKILELEESIQKIKKPKSISDYIIFKISTFILGENEKILSLEEKKEEHKEKISVFSSSLDSEIKSNNYTQEEKNDAIKLIKENLTSTKISK